MKAASKSVCGGAERVMNGIDLADVELTTLLPMTRLELSFTFDVGMDSVHGNLKPSRSGTKDEKVT